MNKEQPHWRPVSLLPVFTDLVDGMLESSLDQRRNLQLAVEKPHVLDDETLTAVIEQYTQQLENRGLFEEQFVRWKRSGLNADQEREVERLVIQLKKLKTANEEILKLASRMEHATIDKIMAMEEVELLDALLTGKIKPPR